MIEPKRIILIVLDSAGIGEMPDADRYGDTGTNTLKHIQEKTPSFNLPNLKKMGLYNLLNIDNNEDVLGSYCKLAEISNGKDTTTGHWEMVGCIRASGFPVYTDGFPKDVIEKFEKESGYKTIGNYAASGTVIINELGDRHLKEKALIVYTSADSVFQIAAHEELVSREELYRVCKIARKILTGKHSVARVIARPFEGKSGAYVRTDGRHDFSLEPDTKTALDVISENGLSVYGIGKINDIFSGKGITDYVYTTSNTDGLKKLTESLKKISNGLVFLNLVDFDMKYGHRRDVSGYYNALLEFDDFLPTLLSDMNKDDILMITADHGCDPTHTGSDHTREYIPLFIYGEIISSNNNLGVRNSFSDIGKTILDLLNIDEEDIPGNSFKREIVH